MLTSLLIAGFVAILIYWVFQNMKRPPNFPPGPMRLPIIGTLLSVGIPPAKGLAQLHKKYGKIVGIFSGSYPSIVLNDLRLIRDAYGDERFMARPDLRPFRERSLDGTSGIIFGSGEKWLEQRKFLVKIFRDMGFGKRDTQETVLEELTAMRESLMKADKKPTTIIFTTHTAIVNVLWTIVAGKRFSYNDPEFQRIIASTSGCVRFRTLDSASIKPHLLFFHPWITKLFPEFTGWNAFKECFRTFLPVIRKYIEAHKDTFDPDNPRDLIDIYLQKIQSVTDPESPFYKDVGENNLLFTLVDLFVAGGETAGANLAWAILHLADQPHVQAKLHEEIDRVIGTSRPPSVADRVKMPYAEACINEALRMATIGSLSIIHATTEHIPDFHGYTLPKNTLVYANLWIVNHDKEVWENPGEFCPERFLGEGTSKLGRINVFSKGKRICPGEGFARDEIFLLLIGLLQHFIFQKDVNSPTPCFDPTMSATLRMQDYNVIPIPRITQY